MTSKKMRLKRINNLDIALSKIYKSIKLQNRICYLIGNDAVCRIDDVGDKHNALVIEYADNIEAAKKGIFGEDGDLFFMDELNENEMLDAMVKEMNNAFIYQS